ncbi:UvrD-helicase domain-containing protein [Mycolicibacter sinensis]|uniref:DNA 3'-5' helicase n=1 Tax=Mycolicibacter sinensis (strain JDM601) TaxID=875328 RepID=A0A1A2ESD3_MYCSD|nr:UvrD-helicase domain-containing protein [Mycolicibacter sinensis]OBG06228.1 DNA helicase UvrD [Mycolicibacter sinensis]OBG07040.1 DNA helicase UvrD [Mycolicibacter sinensis]
MPQIILGPGLDKLDGSLQKLTFSFLAKLAKDDTGGGLHIEPIKNSVDSRARTGRVDLSYRAVLFKLQGRQHEASYVFAGTYPHDEAIAIAKTRKLDINPRNGIAELIPVDDVAPATPTVAPQQIPAPASGADSERSLRAREYTVEDLTTLGIDAAFAAGALDLVGEDALLDYAASAPAAWQGSALLDLYTGESFDEIRAKYQLSEPATVDANDDDAVLEAMQHPAARMQFAFIEDDEELRAAIENPDITAWRIFLHPEQRKYTTRDFKDSFRLTGGAGTGKTVVLLHRARNLHRRNPNARIVLTTFNRTLADALSHQLKTLDPSVQLASDLGESGIYVAGVDAIAHRILATAPQTLAGTDGQPGAVSQVLGARTAQVLKLTGSQAWATAADAHAGELPENLCSAAFLEAEYATVVLPNHITTREEYLKARRTGRGVALNRSRRNAVWNIIETYRAGAAAEGATDFDEKAAIAASVLNGGGERPADHVLVDEGQDLSPCRLQLVRALAEHGPNDLFLAEDSHQRIYGQRIVLSRYGIDIVGRSRRLTLNYRTTQQNLHYALGILSGEQFTDLDEQEDTTAGYRSSRRGPSPKVVAVGSLTEQYGKVRDLVRDWIDAGTAPESIGLLVPTRKEGESLPRALGDRGVTVAFVDRDSAGPAKTPIVMTMHRAKGMEFAKVVLVGVSDKALPRGYLVESLPEEDRADAKRRERSLLYVAATRARDELVVVYVGKPSELLPAGK